MSRIAKQPVSFPESVQISIKDDEILHIQGEKGELELNLISQVAVKIESDQLLVNSTSKSVFSSACSAPPPAAGAATPATANCYRNCNCDCYSCC